MKRLIHIATFILLLSACREPFDFDYPDVEEGRIVIEGYLTDEAMEHKIRVSESSRLGNLIGIEPRYIEDAQVSIVDDQGGLITLSYRNNGEYFTDQLVQAQEGRGYKAVVELADGRIYESAMERLPEGNTEPIEVMYELGDREYLLNGAIQTEEVLLLSNTIQKEATDRFYMWELNEYFIKEADNGPAQTIEEELLLPDTAALRFCYVRDFTRPEIYLHHDKADDRLSGENYELQLQYIRVDSRWKHEFVINVRQLIMDQVAFQFWEQISEYSQNSGSLFDPFPSTIVGNVTSQNGIEQALGYFGVYKTSVFYKTLTYSDLGLFEIDYFPCTPIATDGPCANCRLYPYPENFNNNKPTWWGN